MDLKTTAYEFIRRNGPSLPVKVSKVVERDILFTSAVLSELVSDKKIRLSSAKIGGSPLYYIEGQEARLQSLYPNLGDRPKQAYDLLKKNRVLRDKILEPWQRIALREIKDFAKPIEVKFGEEVELFWRWYLTDLEEARKSVINLVKTSSKKAPERKLETKPEMQSQLQKSKEVKEKVGFELLNEVNNFFRANNINVKEEKIIRKNTEADYIVEVPSQLGSLRYFVKVRKKKKLNEGDLSLAFNKGQEKKLPVLFLSTGELTKKARKYMEENMQGYLLFKQL